MGKSKYFYQEEKMIRPTLVTWIIAIFGLFTFLPLMAAQLLMLFKPNGQKTKDLLIGKGEDWRDKGVVGREWVESRGGRVVLVPLRQGCSTTSIIDRITGDS